MPDDTGNQLFDLADRVIDLAKLVVILLFFIVFALLGFYLYIIEFPEQMGEAASH